jgi:tetratricopeptide (TPR) repeat protein
MKEPLSKGVLPKVLGEIYVARKTGQLHLRHGGEARDVRFHEGRVVHVDGLRKRPFEGRAANDPVERQLGQVLQEVGIQLNRGERSEKVPLGPEALLEAVSWSGGSYSFEEGGGEGGPEPPPGVSTPALIREAICRVHDAGALREALGDTNRAVARSAEGGPAPNTSLSPTDAYVLSRVDGRLTAREIVQLGPLSAEETERSLLWLLCTGLVRYTSAAPRAAGERPSAPPATAPARAPHPAPRAAAQEEASAASSPVAPAPSPAAPDPRARMASASAAVPSAASTSNGSTANGGGASAAPPPRAPATPANSPTYLSAAPDAPLPDELTVRRQEILDAHAGLRTRNHFEVLGISRSASEDDVKEAYFRLVKRFHSDVHVDPRLLDLKEKMEAVFLRLAEAYDVLRHSASRARYVADLVARTPRPAPGPSPGPAPGEAPRDPDAEAFTAPLDPVENALMADDAIRQGEYLLSEGRYWDVIQLLERTVPHILAKRQSAKARAILARGYLKNPMWVRRGEEILHGVLRDEPLQVDACLALGGLYKESGLRSRAVAMFRKVLEAKPDHKRAAAELRELGAASRKLF